MYAQTSNLLAGAAAKKLSGTNTPTSCIVPGQETMIEIDKGGRGLGLSIVGGSDTVLGAVVIHEVYSDGAAAKDGRLEPGDQVLEVNSINIVPSANRTCFCFISNFFPIRSMVKHFVTFHTTRRSIFCDRRHRKSVW